MDKFDTFFGLKLSYLIFSGTEQTSTNIQGKDVSIQEALRSTEFASNYLQRLTSDNGFDQFYSSVVVDSTELTSEPTLPRYRRPPATVDGGSRPHVFSCPRDYYKQQYFKALDSVMTQLSSRFEQDSMGLLCTVENVLIDSANSTCVHQVELPPSILSFYAKDINLEKLLIQLTMLPDLMKASNKSEKLHTVTSIRTICQIMCKESLFGVGQAFEIVLDSASDHMHS